MLYKEAAINRTAFNKTMVAPVGKSNIIEAKIPAMTLNNDALVRDEHSKKMSKSTGNVIDPLAMIDKYGCDSLRFTLTSFAAMGRDIKLSEAL